MKPIKTQKKKNSIKIAVIENNGDLVPPEKIKYELIKLVYRLS